MPTPLRTPHAQEAGRHAQAALAAQAALVAAHEHVSEAKAGLTNPLQHPLVKSFRSSSH